MKLSYLMGTLNIPITTTAAVVTIPEKYIGATVMLLGAQAGDEPIPWKRQATATATGSKLCPDSDITIPLNITKETKIFYAKTISGSGTLEIELWR